MINTDKITVFDLRKGIFTFEKYLFAFPILLIFTLPAVIDKRQYLDIEMFYIGATLLIIIILIILDLFSKITYTHSRDELIIKWGIKNYSLELNNSVSYKLLGMKELFKLQIKAWMFRFPIIIPYIGVICRYKQVKGLSDESIIILLLSWDKYFEIKMSNGNIFIIPYQSDTAIILDKYLSNHILNEVII